jgi:hypothetical protein
MQKNIELIEGRISLLNNFKSDLKKWFNGNQSENIRVSINKNLIAVRMIVADAGTLKKVIIPPPPAIGGILTKSDPFENIFENYWKISLIPTAIDCIEQAIGVYEYSLSDPKLNIFPRKQESIDIETAIERALRPSFKKNKPNNEKDVQDAIEIILNSIGMEYTRDTEVAPVGAKSFKPDFIVSNLNLAIEVKLAKENHSPAKIQEELNADISAYKTKWERLLIIIYDMGVIDDPYKMRYDNIKHFGVSMCIIKH